MELQSSGSETVERAMPDADAVLLKRARSPSPEAEEENKLAIVVVPQQIRPKRTTKLPAKLRDTPALVTPPSRGSEVTISKPCMAVTQAGGGGPCEGSTAACNERVKGEEHVGKLIAVPVMLSEKGSEGDSSKQKQAKSKAVRYQRGLGRKGDSQGGGKGGVQPAEGQSQESEPCSKEEGREISVFGKRREEEQGAGSRGRSVGPVAGGLGRASSVVVEGSPSKAQLKGPSAVSSPAKGCAPGPRGSATSPSGIEASAEAAVSLEVGAGSGMQAKLAGGAVGGRQGGGANVSPVQKSLVRGDSRVGKGKEKLLGEQEVREGRGKARKEKGQMGLADGIKGGESPVGRERTRSPATGRGGAGGGSTAAGNRGRSFRQPQFDHGTLVTTIQHVVTQLADDEIAKAEIRKEEEGERGQASPVKHCDK